MLGPCTVLIREPGEKIVFDRTMVMNLILVCMVCQCNVYVIPESIRRKDLGYKNILACSSSGSHFFFVCAVWGRG
jgi:hypothetical protein